MKTLFKKIIRSDGRSWKDKRFETLRQSMTIVVAGQVGSRETAWVREMARQGISIAILDKDLRAVPFSEMMADFQRYGVQILHVVGPVPIRIKLWALFLKISERWYLKVVALDALPETPEEAVLQYLNTGSDYRYSNEFESLTGQI